MCEQNVWIMDNSKLQRTELAKAFNKKFNTKLKPVAVANWWQRMNVKPTKSKFQGGGSDSLFRMSSNSTDIIKQFYKGMEKLGFHVIVEIERG